MKSFKNFITEIAVPSSVELTPKQMKAKLSKPQQELMMKVNAFFKTRKQTKMSTSEMKFLGNLKIASALVKKGLLTFDDNYYMIVK